MDHILLLKWALNFFELAACITGFLHWHKIKDSYWKWFPIYLGLIVLMEFTGKFILQVLEDPQLNIRYYKYLVIPFQFLFFFWLFRQYFNTKQASRNINIVCAIYIVCWVVDMVYVSKEKWWFSSFSYTIGNIILLGLILSCLYKIIKSDDILQFRASMMFWVCLGLLFFYLGSLPFFGLWNYLNNNHPAIFDNYWYIQMALNYLMYFTFSLGFIWHKPK